MTEAFKAAPSVVPPSYRGREQAWIKHQLLESYLEKLMLIVGMAAKRQGTIEICYVDCFSGPWGTSELESTSIAVSLRTMAKEILQNPPQCLVHVSMQWHPHRP